MSDWITTTVGECLDMPISAGVSTVPARDYRPSGRFPIVDQGARPIAGWTDDESVVLRPDRPLVVFGDHTRALKYVDFPFARGADGTQLLVARSGIEPLFLYYACRAIDLPSRGYNRHFTKLREHEIRLPVSAVEQRAIAGALRTAERVGDHQRRMVIALADLKRAAMSETFTRGLTHEASTTTDVGEIPISWVQESLGSHHAVATGGTPSRQNPAYWLEGTVPWVKTAEVSYTTIVDTEEQVTELAVAESATKVYPRGTLLLAMYGQGVTRGKVAKLGIDAACNQACAAIRSDGTVDSDYLYYFLEWQYENIRGRAHGGQQQNLNLDIVRDIPIAYPQSTDTQRQIAALLAAIDTKLTLHARRASAADELFITLLLHLTSGEIAVSDLDLSALPSDSATPVEAVA